MVPLYQSALFKVIYSTNQKSPQDSSTTNPNSAIHKAAGLTVPGRSMICLVLFHHFTVPTVKPSMGEWPLGVIPATSIFGNGR